METKEERVQKMDKLKTRLLIRKSEVMEMLGGVSVSTIARMIDTGRLPKPIMLSKRLPVWKRHDIEELVNNLEAGDSL